MNTDVDSDTLRNGPTCAWCGHRLAPHECERRGSVCDKCARLLRDAGLPEEEIYGTVTDGGDDN